MKRTARQVFVCIVGAVLAAAGCHSAHVDVSVENRTGKPLRLLEVDYPSASFGTDALAPDSTLRYRIQIRGSGTVSVQYTASDGHTWQLKGPELTEGQNGKLAIVLLPSGKADFEPGLSTEH